MNTSDLESARLEMARKVRLLRQGTTTEPGSASQKAGSLTEEPSEQSWNTGPGSFTAEQFVLLLQLFNVALETLYPVGREVIRRRCTTRCSPAGGKSSAKRSDVLPSEHLAELANVVREALICVGVGPAPDRPSASLGPEHRVSQLATTARAACRSRSSTTMGLAARKYPVGAPPRNTRAIATVDTSLSPCIPAHRKLVVCLAR